MKTIYVLFLTLLLFFTGCSKTEQIQKFDLKYMQNETVTYEEAINYYQQLSDSFSEAKLIECGQTDIGKPLHLFILDKDSDFNPEAAREKNKSIIFINNGIHPGEPCGIDASIQFSYDVLTNTDSLKKVLNNTVICIIPVYNVGGTINRSKYNRANQDTPIESGFRGNGKNLDLNRDFVKLDSENAKSFAKTFTKWRPDVFLDTHTTNGSDHQYTITLIAQNSKSMHPVVGQYFDNNLVPALYNRMSNTPYEMIPYLMMRNYGDSPKTGVINYIPSPRFSTGYTNTFNNFSFMTENHIFKEFKDRVKSVYHFIKILAEYTNHHHERIISVIETANRETKSMKKFEVDWKINWDSVDYLYNFKGYEQKFKKSLLTGQERMYYDKNAAFTLDIEFFTTFDPTVTVTLPDKYIIPQAWKEVIERLKLNNVSMQVLNEDKIFEVEAYYLDEFETSNRLYNGHFSHYNTKVRKDTQQIQFYKGDYIIETNQSSNKFLANVLEPEAPDSYFNWNYFDSALDQREYFSSYVFEEKAIELLDTIPGLKEKFEAKRKTDKEFAKNHRAQLDFIYKKSPYYEKSLRRYPVYRYFE